MIYKIPPKKPLPCPYCQEERQLLEVDDYPAMCSACLIKLVKDWPTG